MVFTVGDLVTNSITISKNFITLTVCTVVNFIT